MSRRVRAFFWLSRLARVLLVIIMLLPLNESLAIAQPLPPDAAPAMPDLRLSGAATTVINEAFDVYTVGGGYLYWAQSCRERTDGLGWEGTTYLKRRALGTYTASPTLLTTETLYSETCSTQVGTAFRSLHGTDQGLLYARGFTGRPDNKIYLRSMAEPTSQYFIDNALGFIPDYNGLTAGNGFVYWVETNGSSSGVATAEIISPFFTRKFLAFGPLTGGASHSMIEIAYTGSGPATIFVSTTAGLYRLGERCPRETTCSSFSRIGDGGSFAFHFESTSVGLPDDFYFINGTSVWRIRYPTFCTSAPCGATVHYSSQTSPQHYPTALGMATDPATGSVVTFVKEYEKTTCAGGPFPPAYCRAYIKRNNAATTVIELGASAGNVSPQDVFSPLDVDPTFVSWTSSAGVRATRQLGGVLFTDVERLAIVKYDAASLDRDVSMIQNIEITQGVQNLNSVTGDVPLVANRPTVVRVWAQLQSGRPWDVPRVQLEGTRNGQPLPGSPLQPFSRPASLVAPPTTPDRGTLDSAFNFDLPASWLNGTIQLTAVADPGQNLVDPNRGNNTVAASASFQRKAPVCLVMIPARVAGFMTPNPDSQSVLDMVGLFRQTWPTYDVRMYVQREPVAERENLIDFGPYEMDGDKDKVLAAISQREDLTDDPDECDDAGAVTYYVGLWGGTNGLFGSAPFNKSYLIVSMGRTSDATSVAANVPYEGTTLAHELGHSSGRSHVLCPKTGGNAPAGPDAGYPYDTCMIGPTANPFTSVYGYHYPSDTIMAPAATPDIMSYGDFLPANPVIWASDYTWKAFMSRIKNAAEGEGVELLRRISAVPATTPIVVATGVLTPALPSADLNPLIVVPAGPADSKLQLRLAESSQPTTSPYRLRLYDSAGTELAIQPIIPIASGDGENGVLTFQTVFTAPVGSVARIEVTNGAAVLATRTVGSSPPSVTVTAPTGGTAGATIDIAWTASDPDASDFLLHTVQYSSDNGNHWQPILTSVPGVTAGGTFVKRIATSDLAPTTGASGLIRVSVSDGYNTTSATSAPFTLAAQPLRISIAPPNGGKPTPAGKPIRLSALVVGQPGRTPASYSWTIDGVAASTSDELSLNNLTTGPHTAQLTVVDNTGLSATGSRTFTVDPLPVPALPSSVAMDGYCLDDAYRQSTRLDMQDWITGGNATVSLGRSGNTLYACFSNMLVGAPNRPPSISLRLDTGTDAAPLDYLFNVTRRGTALTTKGGARGTGQTTSDGALVSRVTLSDSLTQWSAELAIDVTSLGGWGNIRRLRASTDQLLSDSDSRPWPLGIAANVPATWAALNAQGTDLSIGAYLSNSSPLTGRVVTYTVSATNLGTATAPTATVTIALPGGLAVDAVTPASGTCGTPTGGTVTCSLTGLAVGAVVPIQIRGTVTGTAGAALPLSASIASALVDVNPGNNTASLGGTVYSEPPDGAIGSTLQPDGPPPGTLRDVFVPVARQNADLAPG